VCYVHLRDDDTAAYVQPSSFKVYETNMKTDSPRAKRILPLAILSINPKTTLMERAGTAQAHDICTSVTYIAPFMLRENLIIRL